MGVNKTNANKELGFDDMSSLDYQKHWSFSTFNRMLLAAYHISKLPINARVLEIGAGTSQLENLVCTNFKRSDIIFIKVDGDEQYKGNYNIDLVADIMSSRAFSWIENYIDLNFTKFHAVVMMEVIEHIGYDNISQLIENIYMSYLVDEGMLILTTPTPPYNARYEDRVWPTDHEYELTYEDVYRQLKPMFKVIHEMTWSLEERDYYKLLCKDSFLMEMKTRLESAGFPESYIRAQIAAVSNPLCGRQYMAICKAKRK